MKEAAASQPTPEKKYPTDKLLKSSQLKMYQPDFAKTILIELSYSIDEAKAALDKALKGGE